MAKYTGSVTQWINELLNTEGDIYDYKAASRLAKAAGIRFSESLYDRLRKSFLYRLKPAKPVESAKPIQANTIKEWLESFFETFGASLTYPEALKQARKDKIKFSSSYYHDKRRQYIADKSPRKPDTSKQDQMSTTAAGNKYHVSVIRNPGKKGESHKLAIAVAVEPTPPVEDTVKIVTGVSYRLFGSSNNHYLVKEEKTNLEYLLRQAEASLTALSACVAALGPFPLSPLAASITKCRRHIGASLLDLDDSFFEKEIPSSAFTRAREQRIHQSERK